MVQQAPRSDRSADRPHQRHRGNHTVSDAILAGVFHIWPTDGTEFPADQTGLHPRTIPLFSFKDVKR